MNLKAYKTIAWIDLVFFVISAAIAFVLFQFLPSSAETGGTLYGLEFKAGGAFAGFLVSFWILHAANMRRISGSVIDRHLQGNVFGEDKTPIMDAVISVYGQSLGVHRSDQNGWFKVEVKGNPPWTVRASKDDQIGEIEVDADQIHKPLRILLKKKL